MADHETPRVYVWLLGEFVVKIRQDDGTYETVPKTAWASSYARPLFKRLLPATGRRATRSDLIDELWPVNDPGEPSEEESREKRADKFLRDAATKLRQLFGKQIINLAAGVFELAGPSFLWTDIEKCDRWMREAERLDRCSAEAIYWLEKVSAYYKRGGMLEGENGQWCLPFRRVQEEAMWYCHIWLAEGYEAQKKLWHALKQYERLFEINPLDEDALCRLMGMLHRFGFLQSLRSAYQAAQQRFEQYELSLSETTTKLFEHLVQSPPSFALYLTPPAAPPPSSEREAIPQPDPALALLFPITYNESSQSSLPPHLEMPRLLMESRRKAFSDMANIAFASIMLSPYALLSPESREQSER